MECMDEQQDLRLLMDCKRAMAKKHIPLPDIEAERRKFWQMHGEEESALCGEKPRKRIFTLKHWCIAASVAALVFMGLYVYSYFEDRTPVVHTLVYEADHGAQDVRLSRGESVFVLGANTSDSLLQDYGMVANQKQLSMATRKGALREKAMQTLSTPYGRDYEVTLSDGTRVVLNAKSELTFPNSFQGDAQRVVSLKGEAYFQVKHDTKHPFIVRTDYFETKVLGTEFNIRAYSADEARVTLLQGHVQVGNSKTPLLDMKPNDQATLLPDGTLTKEQVDTYPFLKWKEGYFYFDDVSLVEVMRELGRWYNVDVLFENTKSMDYKMHFAADRDADLISALRNLNALGIVYATLDGRRIVVH